MANIFVQTAACAAILLAALASPGNTETYPNGPVALVNPYAAGGPADVLARTIIPPMSETLRQPVVVLNKPGGATAVAAAFVATASPDGQTLLMSNASSGTLRALAVARLKRAEQLPDVPTLDELGFAGFDVTTWYAIAVPHGTPPVIVEHVSSVFEQVLNAPDVKAKLASQGAEVFYLPPKRFVAYLADDAAPLTKLIKSANIAGE